MTTATLLRLLCKRVGISDRLAHLDGRFAPILRTKDDVELGEIVEPRPPTAANVPLVDPVPKTTTFMASQSG
jgi:hypothetical protein